MIYDYIVIGAGISGVTAARLLQMAGVERVGVLEAAPVAGGLCRNNFAPHSAPDGFYRETNLKRWQPGGGELYAETNTHAYPIPTLGWAGAIDSVLRHCAPLGVHGLGRWGQWQYFNSDVCIREAMQLLARLSKPVAAAA